MPRFNIPKMFKRPTTQKCSDLLDKMHPNIKSANLSELMPPPENTANYYIQELKDTLKYVKDNGKEYRSEKRTLKKFIKKLFNAIKGEEFESDNQFIQLAKRLEGKVRRDPEFYKR